MSEPVDAEIQAYQQWTAAQVARPTEDLIQEALAHPENNEVYNPKMVLHLRGGDALFARSQQLCLSADPRERELGADLLGQLGTPDDTYATASVDILLGMLAHEDVPDVLSAIGDALGHRHDPRAVPFILPLQDHEAPCVRGGVVFALLGQHDDAAIAALIKLSADPDSNVRDWATTGLSTPYLEIDTPAIRAALAARLTDPDDVTRGEALVGLASRHDPRVFAPLLAELAVDAAELRTTYPIEAATALADPRLYPALQHLQATWDTAKNYQYEELAAALERCRPPQLDA